MICIHTGLPLLLLLVHLFHLFISIFKPIFKSVYTTIFYFKSNYINIFIWFPYTQGYPFSYPPYAPHSIFPPNMARPLLPSSPQLNVPRGAPPPSRYSFQCYIFRKNIILYFYNYIYKKFNNNILIIFDIIFYFNSFQYYIFRKILYFILIIFNIIF